MFEITEKSQKNALEMNDALKKVTEKINEFNAIAKNSILAISMILAEITEKPKEYLENSGFNTIAEYAENMFGYKKSYTYKLIKISKFVSIKDKNDKKLGIEYLIDEQKAFELAQSDNSLRINVLKDSDGFEYSPSQMLELIPLTQQQIQEHINELDSSLSCKELRAIVKEIINPAIETTANELNTSDAEEQTNENTETPEIVLTDKERILQMLEICATLENEEIKDKMINVFQKALKALEK